MPGGRVARKDATVRIALVSPYSLGRPGGVQGQVAGLAKELRRRDHAVWVLAPGAGDRDARHPGSDSAADRTLARGEPDLGSTLTVAHAFAVPANGSVAPVALSPFAPRRVLRAVRTHGIEVAHLHEPFAPNLGYGLLRHPVVPLVATFHRAGFGLGYRLMAPWARRRAASLSVSAAVSETACQTAQHVVDGEVRRLFNGVDLDRFRETDFDRLPGADGVAPLGGAGPPGGGGRGTGTPVTIAFLGRHEPRKGLLILLQAMEKLDPGVRAGIRLLIASKGPMTSELRRRYPPTEHRRWLGELSDEEVTRMLVEADVLCAPALSGESFGIVLVEAFAARTAVVASDIPGYRAAASGHAVLVPPGDAVALAAALTRAAGDAAGSAGSSAPEALDAARAHAERWSMSHLAERYLELYGEALEGRSSG